MAPPSAAVSKSKSSKGGYAVPSSAFEDGPAPAAALAETPAERAARKAAKAARKAAKAAKAGGDAAPEEKKQKRKRDAAADAQPDAAAEPSAAPEQRAAKVAKATPRVSNTEYRATHEIKVRGRRSRQTAAQRASRRLARR